MDEISRIEGKIGGSYGVVKKEFTAALIPCPESLRKKTIDSRVQGLLEKYGGAAQRAYQLAKKADKFAERIAFAFFDPLYSLFSAPAKILGSVGPYSARIAASVFSDTQMMKRGVRRGLKKFGHGYLLEDDTLIHDGKTIGRLCRSTIDFAQIEEHGHTGIYPLLKKAGYTVVPYKGK